MSASDAARTAKKSAGVGTFFGGRSSSSSMPSGGDDDDAGDEAAIRRLDRIVVGPLRLHGAMTPDLDTAVHDVDA
jgi:hypothetical protein